MTQKLINLIMWTVILICCIIGYVFGAAPDWYLIFAFLICNWAAVLVDWFEEKKLK